MKIEFRKVIVPDEIAALCDLDRRVFHAFAADLFSPEEWLGYESYWMIADGTTIGCSAFLHDTDYDNQTRPGCLHIMSTGVLPELRKQGFGIQQKKWQIDYARQHGFNVIVTNMRQSNGPIIRLNERLGFKTRQHAPHFYSDPDEPAIVMELQL